MKLIKLRSKKFFMRSNTKLQNDGGSCNDAGLRLEGSVGDIKWELRPGGMLVQKRDDDDDDGSRGRGDFERTITVRVSTVSKSHDISIPPTSTFGEMKLVLSMVANLEAEEQRLLFKGKEREDSEYLHMVGVKDQDKVLLLQDPAIRERKLLTGSTAAGNVIGSPYRTIIV